MKLIFNYSDIDEKPVIPEMFKKLVKEIERNEGKKLGEICFIFVSQNRILSINRNFLKHDYVTDVITFNNTLKNVISGDIVVCTDVVRDNGKILKVDYANELLRVMIHGILHLTGYNDDTEEAKRMMHEREDFYLKFGARIE